MKIDCPNVQIFCVAVLLYTPLVCTTPIVVPILSAYCGVITRCVITLVGFYKLVYKRLSKTLVVSSYAMHNLSLIITITLRLCNNKLKYF